MTIEFENGNLNRQGVGTQQACDGQRKAAVNSNGQLQVVISGKQKQLLSDFVDIGASQRCSDRRRSISSELSKERLFGLCDFSDPQPEAKATLERLARIRAQREEAARRRKEEEEARAQMEQRIKEKAAAVNGKKKKK